MTSIVRQTEQALNAQRVPVKCPNCSHETTQTLGWLRGHTEMTCGGCSATIALDTAGLEQGVQSALREARKLDAELSKPIKITLKL